MASESEVSNVSKGVRCQILDWFSPTDIFVGEGEFCCAEPQYKIGRIPLGPNAAAIIIKSVVDPEACVWRPTSDVFSLSQAVGVKVAWPADKLILDDGFDNQDESHNTDGSKDPRTDDQHDSYKILDWNRDEVIAEGVVWSTDQKELVNNIPIGPNAVVMQVYQVINPTAYLWRPSSEMYVMGDALNEKIAWPIDRIELLNINAQEEIRRKSSQSTASNNTGTSKDAKKKCILLECNNSGRKVAEGRVCSTNTTDVVHHVPIGPNASKVWVEVSKIAMDSKDELVKQHAKVAENAVAGWEKAENEVVELKQKLEDAADKNIVLEDRVSHLDGALKECVRQLRQFRDEQEKKIQEAVTEMNKMKRHSM
ncbi:unnamed protein product [Arabidopsis arenosa]|uniref:Transposase Tnp1/En/Spm-like domain-containing protein n=1 Tax=Arabidopsis arenosa TaxID=38785 RepID=A0A8S2ABR4_ARAAE|nr:unnamed protein product [Arabidopsis arenosa]